MLSKAKVYQFNYLHSKYRIKVNIAKMDDGLYQIELEFLDQVIYLEKPFSSRFEALQTVKAIKLVKPKE